MADRIKAECIIEGGWLGTGQQGGRGGLEQNRDESSELCARHSFPLPSFPPSLNILYHHIVHRLDLQFVDFVITVVI